MEICSPDTQEVATEVALHDAPTASFPHPNRLLRWFHWLTSGAGKNTLAIADQALVSGTNFFTTIALARYCGAEVLGVYQLGFTLLIVWMIAQESLVALPYTIQRHRPFAGTPSEFAGSSLLHQLLLSLLAMATLAVGALALSLQSGVPGLAAATGMLVIVVPLVLLREFARRFAFAHLQMAQAFVLDAAASILQLGGLAILATRGSLSANTAIATIGVSSALCGAVWLFFNRSAFVVCWKLARGALRHNWSLGQWIFASQITIFVQAYFVHWLVAWKVGEAATGVYTACMQMVQFSNPLFLGISNALSPRTAQAFNESGGHEVRRVVYRTTLWLAAAMAVFCVVVFALGDDMLEWLYHGQQYEGHGHTVSILAVAMLITGLGMPASNALSAIRRADVNFWVGLLSAALTILLVPLLVSSWGLVGGAYGFLIGNVAATLGRWIAFEWLLDSGRLGSRPTLVSNVLRQFAPEVEPGDWEIQPLSAGFQASIFAVRCRNLNGAPDANGELVVKLFKPAEQQFADSIRGQFEVMARLHKTFDGATADGWRLHAPAPLFHVESPLALVMTLVPGQPLNVCLRTPGRLGEPNLRTIADGLTAAMARFWSVGTQAHGDFNFDNILCDSENRCLSFVDPGVREDVAGRPDGRPWWPASRDLARLLFETEVNVKRTLGKPSMRRRQRQLAIEVIRSFVRRIDTTNRRLEALDEIHDRARDCLTNLAPSVSPRGAWRWFIRQTASRHIDEILYLLREEVKSGSSQAILDKDVPSKTSDTPSGILAAVFATLDKADIPYCLTHGYEEISERITSDVDCVVPADVSPSELATLFQEHGESIGAQVVRCLSGHIVLAGKNAGGSPNFLDLDVAGGYDLNGRRFYEADELLDGRRRYGQCWIPALPIEFGCYFLRRVIKGSVSDEHARKLSDLYRQNPMACADELSRFWSTATAARLRAAIDCHDWETIHRDLKRIRAELLRRATLRQPLRVIGDQFRCMARRVSRAWSPQGGVDVIFLGSDGAGKSSVIHKVREELAGAFSNTKCLMFPPALFRRLRSRTEGPPVLPHDLPPRSAFASIVRAIGYWFSYYTIGYWFSIRPALARSTLVIHDRHVLDALVDAKRYRYAGPGGLLQWIWRLIPKPDLVILLDAPAEVLQARKQELPFEETAKQVEAYRRLIRSLPNGYVVDASAPLRDVVSAVNDVILGTLSRRFDSEEVT
ncbi:MAG: MATE family efflux transporter [Gemmataceae bacterium]